MTELEKAMNYERMSGERLSDTERQYIINGGKFIPPHLKPKCGFYNLLGRRAYCITLFDTVEIKYDDGSYTRSSVDEFSFYKPVMEIEPDTECCGVPEFGVCEDCPDPAVVAGAKNIQ